MVRIAIALIASLVLVLICSGAPAEAGAPADLEAATASAQPAFVVVTQSNAKGTDRAVAVAKKAQALAPGSRLVLVDRAVPENKALVERFRVLSAPVPLILVVAHNGVVAGGAYLKQATPQSLASMVPSPKKADLLLALTQKRPTFLVFSHKDQPTQSQVFEACTQAVQQLDRKATTVVVDIKDKAEQRFLKGMKIDPKAKLPVVVVFNVKGQKTDVYRQAVTAAQLVQSSKKKAPCCPTGDC